MGDRKRFGEFTKLIERVAPDRATRIADVAGGKGYLQAALRSAGYSRVVTFDKRRKLAHPAKQDRYRYKWFSYAQHAGEFDLVAAMHPDEGTDHSVLYAVRNRVPFLVCPCCILPSASCFWDRKNFAGWVAHLKQLAAATHEVEEVLLPIAGKNLVLAGRPL